MDDQDYELLQQAKEKSSNLDSLKKNLAFTAVFFLGGTLFSVLLIKNPENMFPLFPSLLVLFFMWANHQVGEHIQSLNREIFDLENDEGYKSTEHLSYLVSLKFIEIIRP